MEVPEMIWDMGSHCLVFLRSEKLAVAKYLYWTDSTPRIVLLLDTPFSIALYCYWTNFLLHSSVNLSIGDDDHHHIHHNDDDDGDDDDDDYSIHPKALFPAPRAAGRNHHLSDFCQNVSARRRHHHTFDKISACNIIQ